MSIAQTDSRGRLSLGKDHSDRFYEVTESSDGSIFLAPVQFRTVVDDKLAADPQFTAALSRARTPENTRTYRRRTRR
jgi:hypothetical protein